MYKTSQSFFGVMVNLGPSKSSNIKLTQAFQSICQRQIIGAPWYMINNNTLHKYLQMQTVNELATSNYKKFYSKLHSNQNPLNARHVSLFTKIHQEDSNETRHVTLSLLAPINSKYKSTVICFYFIMCINDK